jgi:hypothetical protein
MAFNLKHNNRSKYNSEKTKLDGKSFDSKKEARYYIALKERQKTGEIVFFLRQVPFDLPGNIKYKLDFLEFHSDGTVVFTEVKGYMTPLGKLKIQQSEELYNIHINVI